MTTALAVSGLPTDRFSFEGFPPRRPGDRNRRFAELNANSGGDSPLANTDAMARSWPQLLDFLADPEGHTGTFTAPATPPALTTG